MLESYPISIIAGLLLGYLAGIGVGGGTLLILWLTMVLQLETSTARAINLMFFIAAAGAVSLFRWKQGNLNIRKILPAIISGCISAALFAWLSTRIDADNLKRLFGVLLLITGLRELLYRPRELR